MKSVLYYVAERMLCTGFPEDHQFKQLIKLSSAEEKVL